MTSCMQIALRIRRPDNPDDSPDQKTHSVAASIDLSSSPPAVDVCVYGPKDGIGAVKMESTCSRCWAERSSGLDVIRPYSRTSFWRPNGGRAPLARTEDAFFLVALMEHLSGSPSMVHSLVLQALSNVVRMPADNGRDARVSTLINVMNLTINLANGGPNFCSAIELGLTPRDLWLIKSKGHLTLNRPFFGYAGSYNIAVIISTEKRTSKYAKREMNNRDVAGSLQMHR